MSSTAAHSVAEIGAHADDACNAAGAHIKIRVINKNTAAACFLKPFLWRMNSPEIPALIIRGNLFCHSLFHNHIIIVIIRTKSGNVNLILLNISYFSKTLN
jgi:hypothetical protein